MKNIKIPSRISCKDYTLEQSPSTFGQLRNSEDISENFTALRQRMQADGYLYLPGFLARSEVEKTRLTMLQKLAENHDIFDPAFPLEKGILKEGSQAPAFINNFPKTITSAQKLLFSGRLQEWFPQFLSGNMRAFDNIWFRSMGKGHGTKPHCDIVYMSRGTTDLYTVWIPFGDVSLDIGGLMILENSLSHKEKLHTYLSRDVDDYCVNRPKQKKRLEEGKWSFDGGLSKNAASLREKLGGRWLTTEYKMGDVLIFTSATIHASLDNQTNHIRLSTDTRYQLASEPIDTRWVGENTGRGGHEKRELIC